MTRIDPNEGVHPFDIRALNHHLVIKWIGVRSRSASGLGLPGPFAFQGNTFRPYHELCPLGPFHIFGSIISNARFG